MSYSVERTTQSTIQPRNINIRKSHESRSAGGGGAGGGMSHRPEREGKARSPRVERPFRLLHREGQVLGGRQQETSIHHRCAQGQVREAGGDAEGDVRG